MQIPFELKKTTWRMREDEPYPLYQAGELRKSRALGMVIGVVAAVATMGAGIGVMAASTALAAQISGGAMIAGGLMSGLGAVTGNKKLAMIGGVLSLAGGIGAIGSSLMSSGAAEGSMFAQGSGSSALTDFAKNTTDTFSGIFSKGADAATTAETAATAPTETVGEITATSDVPGIAENTLNVSAPADVAPGTSGTFDINTPPAEIAPAQVQTAESVTSAPSVQPVDAGEPSVGNVGDGFEDRTGEYMKYRAAQEPKGFLSQAWDAVNTPLGKEVATGLLKQAGTGLLANTGSAQEATNAQIGYYGAKTNEANATANLTNQKADEAAQKLANRNAVPLGLNPADPAYAQKKAAAEAAGYRTFDIATPASQGAVTRAPVQTQYTSSSARAV